MAELAAAVLLLAGVAEEVEVLAAAGVAEEDSLDEAEAVDAAEEADSPADVAVVAGAGAPDALLAPSRKSVTYQPEPLSWNPAAVTCLEKWA